VNDDDKVQLDAFLTAGTMLRTAREEQGLSQREVADRLHLMPSYPAMIECDDFSALRHPAFARGYVKAYGRLLGIDEKGLLDAFDQHRAQQAAPQARKVSTRPLQLQQAGLSVIVGLVLLVLLVVAVWWWRAVPEDAAQATGLPFVDKSAAEIVRADSMAGER